MLRAKLAIVALTTAVGSAALATEVPFEQGSKHGWGWGGGFSLTFVGENFGGDHDGLAIEFVHQEVSDGFASADPVEFKWPSSGWDITHADDQVVFAETDTEGFYRFTVAFDGKPWQDLAWRVWYYDDGEAVAGFEYRNFDLSSGDLVSKGYNLTGKYGFFELSTDDAPTQGAGAAVPLPSVAGLGMAGLGVVAMRRRRSIA